MLITIRFAHAYMYARFSVRYSLTSLYRACFSPVTRAALIASSKYCFLLNFSIFSCIFVIVFCFDDAKVLHILGGFFLPNLYDTKITMLTKITIFGSNFRLLHQFYCTKLQLFERCFFKPNQNDIKITNVNTIA